MHDRQDDHGGVYLWEYAIAILIHDKYQNRESFPRAAVICGVTDMVRAVGIGRQDVEKIVSEDYKQNSISFSFRTPLSNKKSHANYIHP